MLVDNVLEFLIEFAEWTMANKPIEEGLAYSDFNIQYSDLIRFIEYKKENEND